jgi:hypothetical protein
LAAQDVPYLPIRQRLRLWAAQDKQNNSDSMPPDMILYGSVSNDLSRTQSTGSSDMDQLRPNKAGMTDEFGEDVGDEDVQVGAVSESSRHPGDLVELK